MTQNVDQIIQETMQSYYEYVVKIEGGCSYITNAFSTNEIEAGIQGIQALSEGLSWLIEAEKLMQIHSYQIQSPISEVIPLFEKINAALEAENFDELGTLVEMELRPLFKHAVDWKFIQKVS
ncbi:hypothetical protein [Solibacillus sp. FSL K6-1523]|uniref:hypothetical protein n=1 Tax=Solibacillus sp. FSL K6-1523 TaxID=2921471 RepID=UPI0030FCC126